MATVVLLANLPSARIGLSRMLADYGHTLGGEEDREQSVWVLDNPEWSAIESLFGGQQENWGKALVVLTDDPQVSLRLPGLGLKGWACVPREVEASQLDAALRAAEQGLVVLAPAFLRGSPLLEPPVAAQTGLLTQRELEVLQLVAQGLPNKGIARVLAISENTAKFHVASLSGKLGATSRAEAVAVGMRKGLILL